MGMFRFTADTVACFRCVPNRRHRHIPRSIQKPEAHENDLLDRHQFVYEAPAELNAAPLENHASTNRSIRTLRIGLQ